MSLYNTLLGVNPAAHTLLALLGASHETVPRFRDCYIKGNTIVIFTRTGGGNRDAHEAGNAYLRTLPGFRCDHDDPHDPTYAHFAYSIPLRYLCECEMLRGIGAERDPTRAMAELLAKLSDPAMREDPQVLAVLERMRPTMERLSAAFDDPNGPRVFHI